MNRASGTASANSGRRLAMPNSFYKFKMENIYPLLFLFEA